MRTRLNFLLGFFVARAPCYETRTNRELKKALFKPVVERFLAERGLLLSEEKTSITQIKHGFKFLGQTRQDIELAIDTLWLKGVPFF